MDQRALVEAAARGDHDAFAVLAGSALGPLDATARLILRDTEQARDAVQETLVRAWRDLPRLRDPERFHAWLYSLTVHACLDIARRRRRRVAEVELTPLIDRAVADTSSVIADRDQLERGLNRLKPEQRAIIVLRYYLDLSLPEAAVALGIPLGTAKSRLNSSLRALRTAISPETPIASRPITQEPLP